MPNLTLGDAVRIAGHVDAIRADAVAAVNVYGPEIQSELDTWASELSEHERAAHALTFALMSARCPFDKNAAVTPPLVDAIHAHADREELERIIRAHGLGLARQKSRYLSLAADHIRTATADTMSPDALQHVRGAGPKIRAMAAHLFNEHARCFTLDTHMLRGLCRLSGIDGDTFTVTDAAYSAIEAACLEACSGIGDAPFVAQWALWCEWTGRGFISHSALFGLE